MLDQSQTHTPNKVLQSGLTRSDCICCQQKVFLTWYVRMDRHREEKAKNEPTYPSIVLIILSQPLMWTQTRAFLQAAEEKSIIPKTFVCINRVLWVWSQRHHVTGYCSTLWPPHPFILEPLIVDFMKASNVSPLFLNVPLLILCVGKLTTLVSTNVGIIENLCGFALRRNHMHTFVI